MRTILMEKKPRRPQAPRKNKFSPVLLLAMALLLCLAGCKTSRHAGPSLKESTCLSSKVKLTVPSKQSVLTVNGTMKLVRGERMQLSFLMPILRTEVARIEVTPDDILLVDRMGKRYVRATRRELRGVLPKKADFAHLEKLLYAAARPEGKTVVTAESLGLHQIEGGKIEFSDFSTRPLTLSPTQLSSKYTEVEWYELLHLLMSL